MPTMRADPIVLLALIVPIAAKAEDTAYRFEETYDRFEDRTTLRLELGDIIKGGNYKVDLTLFRFDKGRLRTKGRVELKFLCDSSDGWRYLRHHPLDLLVDGKRWSFQPTHDGTVGQGYVLEHIWAHLTEAQLADLAAAKSVEGRLGINEFALSRDQLAAIREFAALLDDPKRPVPAPPAARPGVEAPMTGRGVMRKNRTRRAPAANPAATRAGAESDTGARATTLYRQGQALEKSNPTAALGYYRDLLEQYPDAPEATKAKARVKALVGVK
jgi:hypothetical protein